MSGDNGKWYCKLDFENVMFKMKILWFVIREIGLRIIKRRDGSFDKGRIVIIVL